MRIDCMQNKKLTRTPAKKRSYQRHDGRRHRSLSRSDRAVWGMTQREIRVTFVKANMTMEPMIETDAWHGFIQLDAQFLRLDGREEGEEATGVAISEGDVTGGTYEGERGQSELHGG